MATDSGVFTGLLPVCDFAVELGVPWLFAGGWATDLFIGYVTRAHDLLVFDRDQDRLRVLSEKGVLRRRHQGEPKPWSQGERLVAGPDLLEPAGGIVGDWKVELIIGMTRAESWVWHRGNQAIVRPLTKIGLLGPLSLPYLAPEVSLRTRASDNRESDELDFRNAAPLMSTEQRQWLRNSLPQNHPWRAELERLEAIQR